jgi:hypothetical protein
MMKKRGWPRRGQQVRALDQKIYVNDQPMLKSSKNYNQSKICLRTRIQIAHLSER